MRMGFRWNADREPDQRATLDDDLDDRLWNVSDFVEHIQETMYELSNLTEEMYDEYEYLYNERLGTVGDSLVDFFLTQHAAVMVFEQEAPLRRARRLVKRALSNPHTIVGRIRLRKEASDVCR